MTMCVSIGTSLNLFSSQSGGAVSSFIWQAPVLTE
jgi:hypothetical protein